MEHFQPNPNLYTIKPPSFTSDDEFVADKRVHITNEIPPEDMFDKAHSKLHNDFWKWFLGSTRLSFATDGIEYNMHTNGVEIFDRDGNILEASIAKYINGNRAKDYGPLPLVTFNAKKNDYEIANQTYNRFEIEGTLMPEFDFILHEGYRYLGTLYPDHPDYTEILTNNELNDDILHAAAMVHYFPNVTFFDWLAQYFEYDHITEDQIGWIQNKEALKLKIRNLRNNTFRRKLYGSKSGYHMFGSEIFQHMMVYPIAEYLPFLPKDNTESNASYNEGHKKFTWFKDIYNAPADFKNDGINRYNRLYKKAFRLVDWDNSSYDYEHQYVPPTVVYGTAYPTPLSNYDIYEWPIDRDWKTIDGEPITYVPPSIANDFYEGQKISIKDPTIDGYRDVYINAIFAEDTYRVQAYLDHVNNEFTNRLTIIPESITRVQLDGPAYPLYTKLDVYSSVEKTLQTILDANRAVREVYQEQNPSWIWAGKYADQFLIENTPEQTWLSAHNYTYYNLLDYDAICNDNIENKLIRSMRALYKVLDNHKAVKFTLEPLQDGNLFMPAQYLMTCYNDWLNVYVDKTDKNTPQLIWGATDMADDAYVHVADVIVKSINNASLVSEIVGLEGGLLKFDITHADTFSQKQKALVDQFNEEEIGKYGVVIRFHKNNEVSAGKLVVVFGKPRVVYSDPDKNGNYRVLQLDLELQAIPKVKSHELMLALYPTYENVCAEKFANLEILFGKAASFPDDNLYKAYFKEFESVRSQTAKLLPAMEVLIKQNRQGAVHPNDTYWQNVKSPFITIINSYNLRPTLREQLSAFYDEFIAKTDVTATIITPEQFEANCREILVILQTYNDVYFSWIADIVSIDLDRSYYESIDASKLADDKLVAIRKVRATDVMLNDMLTNRAYLLKPMPTDLWMKSISDEESSYSLLYRQDEYVSLLEYGIDEYHDLITFNKQPIFGTNGVLTDFKFGSLNTASIVNNDEDLTRIQWEYYASTEFIEDAVNGEKYGLNYVKWYNIEDYRYITLNKDILTSVAENNNLKKFSYATPLFLELFLPQEGLNNIFGEIIPPYKVEIRSILTKGSNIISFIDEESMARLACISTGDRVIGNGVEDDIFVDYIDYDKKQIRVKKTNLNLGEADFVFMLSDDLVLTYLCKMNLFAKDVSKDFFRYRTELSRNKLLDFGSIMAHGPYDQYSNTYLNGIVDVDHFINRYKLNLQSQDLFRQYFNKFVWDLYNNGESATNHFVIPSIVNCVNELFVEVGAYKRYDITEYNPVTKTYEERYYTDQYIMKKEILDYFQESLSEISKSSDLVNLGVNIIAATTSDGAVSRIPGEEFTDPKIKLKFATYNWSYESMPYYIDIGVGELKSFWNRSKKEFEDQKRFSQDHSYYNYDVYGNKYSESSDVGYWSQQEFSTLDLYDLPVIDRIDKPIMRVYLGEYEVQKLISFDDYTNKKFTTVQFSIIKQIFKNLEKKNSDPLIVLNESYFTHDIFKNITSFNEGYTENDQLTTYFAKSEFKNYYYLGVWKPTKDLKTDEVIYPIKIEDSLNIVYYYAIDEEVTLMNVRENGQTINKTFKAGTVLMLLNKQWEYFEFSFAGLLGNVAPLKSQLDLNDSEQVDIKHSFPPEYRDITVGKTQKDWPGNLTLKHRLLYKLVNELGLLTGPEALRKQLDCATLEKVLCLEIAAEKDPVKIQTEYAALSLSTELIAILPTTYVNSHNISYHQIYWFLYTVGTKSNGVGEPLSWELFESKASIQQGTAFALVPHNDGKWTFKIIILNENEFLFKINSNNEQSLIDQYEFNTFLGLYGHQKSSSFPKLFLYEKLKQYQNSIELKYRYLLEGSVDVKFDMHPQFKTEGWKYRDDGTLEPDLVKFDFTKTNIYYDDVNHKLYTYDNDQKYAIKQEEHKFFKNVLYIYGTYAISTNIQNNKYVQVPEISQIEGIKFNADYLSLLDRILSIEQINIRSLYDINLESVLFSSYCNIKGIIKGIFVDPVTNLQYLNIGYADDAEPVLTSNKLKYATELLKILPVRENEDLQEDDLHFNYNDARFNAKWLDTNERIFSPEVKHFNVTELISNYDSNRIFSYYKNTLVLEGLIDLYTPNYISFEKNPKLKDALDYLRIDDTIEGIHFIESAKQSKFETIEWPGHIVKFMDYKQDKLLIANATNFLFTDAFKTIGDVKNHDGGISGNVYTISGKLGFKYDSLDSLAYEKHNNRWLLSLSNSDVANPYAEIISIDLDNNTTGHYDACYNTTGIDVNTYQRLHIAECIDQRSIEDDPFIKGLTPEQLEGYELNLIQADKTEAYILARDLSITTAPTITNDVIISGMIIDGYSKPAIEQYLNTAADKVEWRQEYQGFIFESPGHSAIEDKTKINTENPDGTVADNGGGIWKLYEIAVDPKSYKTVTLNLTKLSTTPHSPATLSLGCYDGADQIWLYDKITEKWTVSTATLYNHNFVNYYNTPFKTYVTCYIIGQEYGVWDKLNSVDSMGMMFHHLPKPEVTDNSIVCAVLVNANNRAKLKITINGGKGQIPGKFLIANIQVRDPIQLVEDPSTPIVEGPYNPLVTSDPIEAQQEKFTAKRWVANNHLDNEAIIIGSTLFMYTPTKTYKKVEQDDKQALDVDTGEVTRFSHWKRAELPSSANVTYELFNQVEKTLIDDNRTTGQLSAGLYDLYNMVYANYEYMKTLLDKRTKELAAIAQGGFANEELTALQTLYDWLLKPENKPKQYSTEEAIPIVIDHTGVELLFTEQGKIPNFKPDANVRWQAAQDVLVELGLATEVYFKKQNYLRYLADYYAVILGSQRFKQFFTPGNVKDVLLTNSDLIIQTGIDDIISLPLEYANSRDNIENYNNWNISNVGEEYVFSSNQTGEYTTRTIGVNGVYYTVEQAPVQETVKAFTVLEKFIYNNVQIYAGYIQVNEAVKDLHDTAKTAGQLEDMLYLTELFPNNLDTIENNGNKATWEFSLAKYPVIFYSQDNGKHFSKWSVPTENTLGLQGAKTLYSLTNPGDEINNPDFAACQIFQKQSEIRIQIRKRLRSGTEWTDVGHVLCYLQTNKDTSELMFNDAIIPLDPQDKDNAYFDIIRSRELFAGINVYYASSKALSSSLSDQDVHANHFYLLRPYTFNLLTKPKITQIDDNGVTFNYSSDEDLEHETLRVLVAINPYNLLENNSTYLDYKTEYLNSYGEFAVPTFIEVDSIDQANRLYSARECMTTKPATIDDPTESYQRSQTPKRGIPAISEDTDHKVYQYYSPFVNSKGETITRYIEATNSAQQIVKLCRLNGEYLTSRDSPTNNNYFTWASMILNAVPYEALVAAPLLAPNYEATTQDEILTPLLNTMLSKKVTIDYINFTNRDPQLDLDIYEINSRLITEMQKEHLFYEVKSDKNAFDAEFYNVHYDEGKGWDDWAALRDKTEAIDGPFHIDKKPIESKFGIYNLNGTPVFFDKFTNTIILKKQNNIEVNFNVPYIFKNGQQVYNNYLFNLNDDHHTLTKYEDSYPITSVYIPPKGYGGSLNNPSWDKIRPEENDYQAFEFDENKNPYLTINDEADYIYLSDANGVKLLSRNGLFWLETAEQLELTYNKLFAEKQSVKFWPSVTATEYESYQNEPSEYNFYKLPLTPISVYVPKRTTDENGNECGKVHLANPAIRSGNSPIKDGIYFQIPVTLFKLHKAGWDGTEQNPTKDDYTFTFYDADKELTNFRYNYDRQLIVYLTENVDGNFKPISMPQVAEKITVHIEHKVTHQRATYDLYTNEGMESGLVLSSTSIPFNGDEFLSETRNVSFTFDRATITVLGAGTGDNPSDKITSNDQTLILESDGLNSDAFIVDFKEYPTLNYILFNEEPLYLDIRDYDIKVLTEKDWVKGTEKIAYSLYTGDQFLESGESTSPDYEVGYQLFSVKLNPPVKDLTLFKIDNNIFTWDENDLATEKKFRYSVENDEHKFSADSYSAGVDAKMIVSGLPGNVLFNYPKYRNFKELINTKLQIIEYKVPKMLAIHPMDNEIIDINAALISFKIKNEVPGINLDNPYLKIKIMPVQTVYPEVRYLNNLDYIQEVDILEKDTFGYDRVWINESLVTNPPIVYRNFLYNESFDYFTNVWKNKDDYMVYLSDSSGRVVKPGLVNGKLKFTQIDTDNSGDCRPWIYGNVDPRFNPPELILKTSIEKYLNDYYIKGLEINPLILTLNIKDEYNVITQKFDKVVHIYSKKRADNTIEYVPIENSYITAINQNLLYDIGDKIYQNMNDSYFDYENGLIKFTLRGPSKDYKLEETKYFYGIKYSVEGNDLLNSFVLTALVNNDIRSSFYINTKEDLTDKKNKDHAIVEITEMGIFDKYDHLCAYLTHPKVQYRSDSTHLSYSLLIEEA